MIQSFWIITRAFPESQLRKKESHVIHTLWLLLTTLRIWKSIVSMQLGFKMIRSCQMAKIFDKEKPVFHWISTLFRFLKNFAKFPNSILFVLARIFHFVIFKIQTLFEAWKGLILMKIDIGRNLNKLSKLLKNRLSQIEMEIQNLINLKTSIQMSNWKKSGDRYQSKLMCPTHEPQ